MITSDLNLLRLLISIILKKHIYVYKDGKFEGDKLFIATISMSERYRGVDFDFDRKKVTRRTVFHDEVKSAKAGSDMRIVAFCVNERQIKTTYQRLNNSI